MSKTKQLYGQDSGHRVITKTNEEEEEIWIVKGSNDLMEIESADEAIRLLKEDAKGDD